MATLRRPVQICIVPAAPEHSLGVIALCADGTIWESFFRFDPVNAAQSHWGPWEQLPAIPGSEESQ